MLDSNDAVDPAKTLAAICFYGEFDLNAGERYEFRRRRLDDLAAHSF